MKRKLRYQLSVGVPRKHLDFGCGRVPRNPFQLDELFTVDTVRHGNHPTNLIEPGSVLPFKDNTFGTVSAYDVFEHLSRDFRGSNLFILYMNEVFRVLAPGGIAVIVFPAYPSNDAFADPTHVNFITQDSVNYFISPGYEGINTNFQILVNKRLRFWRNWVDLASIYPESESRTIRRKISLAKRSLKRIVLPGHIIWILRKPA